MNYLADDKVEVFISENTNEPRCNTGVSTGTKYHREKEKANEVLLESSRAWDFKSIETKILIKKKP